MSARGDKRRTKSWKLVEVIAVNDVILRENNFDVYVLDDGAAI